MKKIFMIILIIILSNKFVISVDTNAIKYVPLAVGNKWVFNVYWFYPNPGTGVTSGRITKDTVINGKKYFFNNVDFLFGWIRIDSTTGNLYLWTNYNNCPKNPYETFLDSVAGNYNDTFYHCEVSTNGSRIFYDSTSLVLSGTSYKTKRFRDRFELSGTTRSFARGIGFCGAVVGDPWAYTYALKGCVINGVVYGDTNIVGMQNISGEIPEKITLYQNYPNPFNPETKIEFTIPPLSSPPSEGGDRGVVLKIYDVLGREAATLVNEKLKPGTYEVDWNGNDYPSGVYFYKLISEDFSESKRMVLIK
jgi:hypothetical protein